LNQVLAVNPEDPDSLGYLGTAMKDTGDLDSAIACYRKSLAIKPDHGTASNLVYTIHFHSGFSAQAIRVEHDEFNKLYCQPLARQRLSLANDRNPNRKIRVGYLSPDFRFHPVGRFMLPLLRRRNTEQFTTICYHDIPTEDGLTRRLREQSDVWNETAIRSDEELAALIRSDQIDILVDLTAHMDRNRMLVFARKPAPVQVTYLAYCSTTGLETMDYRISDPYLDEPDRPSSVYAEQTLTLPSTYWCFEPVNDAIRPAPLPLIEKGYVTFGCLNNFAKVTPETLDAWFELLSRLQNSRLRLYAPSGAHRSRVLSRAEAHGLRRDQVDFAPFGSFASYLDQYRMIDIVLDPFPYGGGTTTCDALWMGLPVVTLCGETAVSRAGLSLLSNVGLERFVATDADAYVNIAEKLAGDTNQLLGLRQDLQMIMMKSSLMDSVKFACDFERLLRTAWIRWCTQ